MTRSQEIAKSQVQRLLRSGLEALGAGQAESASRIAQQLLRHDRQLPEGHFLVGLVALELRDRRTAFQAFASVTQLEPENGLAWAHLAKLFASGGQPARADAALVKALQYDRADATSKDIIGTVLSLLGEQGQAAENYQAAVTMAPDRASFRVNLANAALFLGQMERAEAEIETVLEQHPRNPQAHWMKSNLRRADSDAHLRFMRTILEDDRLSPQGRAFLNYAVGKEAEDLGLWPSAFEAFSAGAAARRSIIDYDEDAEVDMFAALEDCFDATWLAGCGAGVAESRAPIFVVGQPRTGTTLIERVITSHSVVHSAGELRQFGLAIRRLSDYRGTLPLSATLVRQAASLDPAALGTAYLRSTERVRGPSAHYVDKLPGNYLFLPLILAALPQARVIHVRRHPVDACFASFKQLFADAYPHSYDQTEMARHYLRYDRLMSIWRERFPGRFYDVDYESVTANLEEEARGLIDYLELPWEPQCLAFHEQATAVTTASAVQVREPAHTRSVGRWRRYEKQLLPLLSVLREGGIEIPAE